MGVWSGGCIYTCVHTYSVVVYAYSAYVCICLLILKVWLVQCVYTYVYTCVTVYAHI